MEDERNRIKIKMEKALLQAKKVEEQREMFKHRIILTEDDKS